LRVALRLTGFWQGGKHVGPSLAQHISATAGHTGARARILRVSRQGSRNQWGSLGPDPQDTLACVERMKKPEPWEGLGFSFSLQVASRAT